MFENLTDKLQRAFKNLRGQGTLTEENIGEALKEIRMALLEADVNFKVVKELVDHIRDKALGQEVLTSLSPAEQVVKIVRDELVNILGKDTAQDEVRLAAADRRADGGPAGVRQNDYFGQAGVLAEEGRTSSACWFRWTSTVPPHASS